MTDLEKKNYKIKSMEVNGHSQNEFLYSVPFQKRHYVITDRPTKQEITNTATQWNKINKKYCRLKYQIFASKKYTMKEIFHL